MKVRSFARVLEILGAFVPLVTVFFGIGVKAAEGDSTTPVTRLFFQDYQSKAHVEGYSGHHDMGFDADREWAFFTNPGAGTISVLSLRDPEIKAEFKVGGIPTVLVARGGSATEK